MNIKLISTRIAREFIIKYHYSHSCHNRPFPCYGLYDDDSLVGVCIFANTCSEKVRENVFGKDRKNEVIELHRLYLIDELPKNSESWFISRCLKLLKKDRPITNSVIAFSDPTEGHIGTIYKATNALYVGMSRKATFYRDNDGHLRHPRQNGKNITINEAITKGWSVERRLGKHKYIFLLGSGPKIKLLKRELLLFPLPFPSIHKGD